MSHSSRVAADVVDLTDDDPVPPQPQPQKPPQPPPRPRITAAPVVSAFPTQPTVAGQPIPHGHVPFGSLGHPSLVPGSAAHVYLASQGRGPEAYANHNVQQAPYQTPQGQSLNDAYMNSYPQSMAHGVHYPVNALMNGIGQHSLLYRPAYGDPNAPSMSNPSQQAFQMQHPNGTAVHMLQNMFPYPSGLGPRPGYATAPPPVVRLQGSVGVPGYAQGGGAMQGNPYAQRSPATVGMQYTYSIPPPVLRFSMINAKEFVIETEGILSNDLIAVLKSVAGGRQDDSSARRWIMPLSAHEGLHVGLSAARAIVEPLPREVLAAITIASKRSGSATGANAEEEAREDADAMATIKDRIPARLVSALAPFQRRGVAFGIRNEGRVFIADEMGLGKSIQALAVAAAFVEDWPVLIVTPSSARYHWRSEVHQWLAPELVKAANQRSPSNDDVFVVDKTKAKNLPAKGRFKFMIASYNSISKISELLKGYQFKTVIVDESHYLKNHKASRTASLGPILTASKRAILLSGTPALSRPIELFSQLHLLRADLWPDRKAFGQRYCRTGGRGWSKEYAGCSNSAELHALLLSTVMVRRLKSSVAMELPDKTRYLIPIEVEDTEREQQMLELLKVVKPSHGRMSFDPNHFQGDQHELGDLGGSKAEAVEQTKPEDMTDEMRQLRKMSMMQLFDMTGIAKVGAIMKYIKRFLEDPLSGKLVVFAHHRNVLDALDRFLRSVELRYLTTDVLKEEGDEDEGSDKADWEPKSDSSDSETDSMDLDDDFRPSDSKRDDIDAKPRRSGKKLKKRTAPIRHHCRGVDFIRIDGRTDSKQRFDNVTKFQTSGSCRVALLAITAAGVALTLTAASTVYFTELFWTPGSLLQAEDRVHRIGQIHTVKIFYFLGKNTCDELIWPLIRSKIRTLGTVLEGRADADFHRHAHKFNKNARQSSALALDDKGASASTHTEEDSSSTSQSSRPIGMASSRLSSGPGRQLVLPFKPLKGTAGGKRAANVVFPSQIKRKRRFRVVSDESDEQSSDGASDEDYVPPNAVYDNEEASREVDETKSDNSDENVDTSTEIEGLEHAGGISEAKAIVEGDDFDHGLFDADDLLALEGVAGELAEQEAEGRGRAEPGDGDCDDEDEGEDDGLAHRGRRSAIPTESEASSSRPAPRALSLFSTSDATAHAKTSVQGLRKSPLRPVTPVSRTPPITNWAASGTVASKSQPRRREDVEIIVIDSSDFESDEDAEEEGDESGESDFEILDSYTPAPVATSSTSGSPSGAVAPVEEEELREEESDMASFEERDRSISNTTGLARIPDAAAATSMLPPSLTIAADDDDGGVDMGEEEDEEEGGEAGGEEDVGEAEATDAGPDGEEEEQEEDASTDTDDDLR